MAVCEPGVEVALADRQLDLPEGVPPLTTFYLYLTNGCNLACRHCWITPNFVRGEPDPGEVLPPELLHRAVAQALPLGLRAAKLTGGEPTQHPQFREIVDLLTAAGLQLTMETNGTLIDAALARYLKERTNLWFVSVSIDGPDAAVHDAFRGVPGSFDAATRGFRALVEAGYRPQLIMSPHRGTVQHIEAVVALAASLGAGSVKFNPVTATGRGEAMHARGEALEAEEILDLAHWIRGELQARTPVKLILSTPLAFYSVQELLDGGQGGMCHVRHILGILGDGQMALCGIGRTIPALCFGNLRDTDVREAWLHAPLLRELRAELDGPYPGLCGACIHAGRCLAYCVADNYQHSGRLVTAHQLCEQARAAERFPVGRLRGGA